MRRILSALALLACVPPTLAAQESELLRSYPAELVLGLLAVKADNLTVGAVPEEVAEKLPLPPEAEVLGALDRNGSVNIVASVEGTANEVAGAYRRLLESRGWIEHQQPEQRGLLSDGRRQGRMYCADDDSFVSFNAGPGGDDSTRLAVQLMAGPGYTPCSHQRGDRYRDPMDAAPFPALHLPEGARTHGSSSSSGPDFTEQSILLMSDLPLADLLDHYATQLRAAGWTELEYCQQSSLGLQTWRVDQADGPSWDGVLTVSQAGAEAKARSISLRLSRPDWEEMIHR